MLHGVVIAYVPPPKTLRGFPAATKTKRKTPMGDGLLRERWKDDDGTIYEWDYRHGRVERYDRRGRHLGEHDAETGEEISGAIADRWVEP